ncbi:MAG: hypothetical protein GEU93_18025 [Propionibacteriales bacterium]|nr:hypothetical protein [Propionibacteriales bacterium]
MRARETRNVRDVRARQAALLVAVTFAVLSELLRVASPLLYDLADDIGYVTAAWLVPVIFAGGLLAAPLGRLVRAPVLLAVGAVGLALARIVAQVQSTPSLPVVLPGVLLGIVALGCAVRVSTARSGRSATACAVVLGLVFDTGVRLALVTWDAAWRGDVFSWSVGLVLPVVAAGLAWSVMRAATGAPAFDVDSLWGSDSWRLAALPCVLLALQTLFFANPGFTASSVGVSLPVAGGVTLVTLAAAAALVVALDSDGRLAGVAGGWLVWVARVLVMVAVVLVSGPGGLTGIWALILVSLGQVSAIVVFGAACTQPVLRRRSEPLSAWRTGLGAGLGSVALVAILLSYHLAHQIPLVGAETFAGLGAFLLVAGSVAGGTTRRVGGPARWVRVAAVATPVLALAVPVWLAISWPSPESEASPSLRVATYNTHSSVSQDGALDPERTARVLETGGADVAMLQEVPRGWLFAGGLDQAAWLSRRMAADLAYGRATDSQFGNAVLSTYPVADEWSGLLFRADPGMDRGYVGVEVPTGVGVLNVWSTHLQFEGRLETRQAQARSVLAAWDGAPRTVIGGDFNMRPGSAAIVSWFDGTGLVSAQDAAGDPTQLTAYGDDLDRRIDWILATPDVELADAAVRYSPASDHMPVFVTVRLPE